MAQHPLEGYEAPVIEIIDVESTRMLCISGEDTEEYIIEDNPDWF